MLHDQEIDSLRSNLKLPPVEKPSIDSIPETGGAVGGVTIGENGEVVMMTTETGDVEVERLEKAELDSLLMPPPGGASNVGKVGSGGGLKERPSLASLGIRDSIEECMKVDPGKNYVFYLKKKNGLHF